MKQQRIESRLRKMRQDPAEMQHLEDLADRVRRRRAKALERKEGWIYLIKIVDGPTKIGLTWDHPGTRARHIDYGVPYPTEFIGLSKADDAASLEREIHNQFANKRIKGEWFDLSSADIAEIFNRPGFGKPADVLKADMHDAFRKAGLL